MRLRPFGPYCPPPPQRERSPKVGTPRGCAVATVKSNGGPINTERDIVWREQYAISGMNTMGMGIFYEALRRWVGDCTLVTTMAETFVKSRTNSDTGARECTPTHTYCRFRPVYDTRLGASSGVA